MSTMQTGIDGHRVRTTAFYKALTREQELIGVYGYYDQYHKLSNLGFIVKEKVINSAGSETRFWQERFQWPLEGLNDRLTRLLKERT